VNPRSGLRIAERSMEPTLNKEKDNGEDDRLFDKFHYASSNQT